MRFPRFSRRGRIVLFGCLAAAGALGLLASVGMALFTAAGGVDVAADRPHSWPTYQLLHFAFNRSVALRASSLRPPDDLGAPSRVKLGAQHFHLVCSNCHGGPGLGQSPVALSMTPRPQHLPAVVGQFSDAELFWILQHGVKFSAMPAWTTRSRADEVWSMVAFLRELPKLSASDYLTAVTPPPASPEVSKFGFGETIALRDADTRRNTFPRDEHLYAAPAVAFGDKTILADALAVCARCHGADGTGRALGGEAPDLTIQSAEYLEKTLHAYSDGHRLSGFMEPIASEMTDGQIKALADYFSSQPPQPAAAGPSDAALVEAGRRIASEGFPDRAIPGCATCHESAGAAVVSAPSLSGQSETYLRRQLTAMRDYERGSTRFWNPMPAVARVLSDESIAAVAAFYASRPPAPRGAPLEMAAAHPAEGDGVAGEKMFAQVCAKCHTPEALGDAQGDFPDLTLQSEPYVSHALHAYRIGLRKNEKMNLVTAKLSDDEIAALAAYLGSLPPQPGRAEPDASAAKRGAAIATEGLPDRGVPACLGCHGGQGVAAIPVIASIHGQNVNYLKNKLAYFAGPLANDIGPLNPMPLIARHLSTEEQADVAAYFASQAPLGKSASAN